MKRIAASSRSWTNPGRFVVLGMIVGLGACARTMVSTDYDPQASFAGLDRYDWVDSTDIVGEFPAGGPFLAQRIKQAVDQTLATRGFVKETAGEVDFLVTAFVVEPAEQHAAVGGQSGLGVSVGIGGSYVMPYYADPFAPAFSWYRYPIIRRHDPFLPAPVHHVGFGTTWLPHRSQPGNAPAGTLVVDVFDAATGELIWRGWVDNALIDPYRGVEEQEYLNELVAEILKDFPPS